MSSQGLFSGSAVSVFCKGGREEWGGKEKNATSSGNDLTQIFIHIFHFSILLT